MTTSSQATDGTLERRVATFLRDEAPGVAPPGLLDGALRQLDAAPTPNARPRLAGLLRSPEWLGLGLMAAFVVVVVGAVALGGGSGSRTGAGAGSGAGSAPDYDGIRFQASGLVIDAAAQRFTLDPAKATVTSDPGNTSFRTLEWSWTQNGVPMRLNLYFASDGSRWWASEVRTYDGRQPGNWLAATGRFFERPAGSAYDGPVDMTLPDAKAGTGVGRLHVDRLVLLPTFKQAIVASTTGPVADPGDGGPVAAPNAFAAGQLLHCIGAEKMTPQQLALYARGKGYPVEYRYLKDGYSATREPPAGSELTDALWGSSGELIIFASAPAEPSQDQVRLTAERACPAGGDGK
jgi:hypothetical protein